MRQPLKVLLVEDAEDDAVLVLRALYKGGIDATAHRVQNAESLTQALDQHWDIVLSDFSLLDFNGMDALILCRTVRGDIPFILVSGTVGEEMAVALMKAGANDYVMKHDLARLAPAILRELNDAGARARLRRTELELIASEKRFHAFMDASPFAASIKDHEGRYLYMNKGWNIAFGTQSERWVGLAEHPSDKGTLEDVSDLDVMTNGEAVESIDEYVRPDRAVSCWKKTRFPFIGASGQRFLGEFSTDITALKASEETIRRLAFLDPLTGLANRRLMQDRLTHALALAARSKEYGALLFLDLDHFKNLNDAYGHDVGDQILKQTGERLTACTRAQDTVARAGGDEYVIILEKLNWAPGVAATEADAIGRKILGQINAPYTFNGVEYKMTASIGIALFRDMQSGPDELMKRADIALYSAKAAGRNNQLIFDPAMQAGIAVRNEMEMDLNLGLERRYFKLHYQPQVDNRGIVTGVEALLRLQHPTKGLIMPAAFIGFAEETGFIVELGYWALETACEQLQTWSAVPSLSHLTISVNVSARQFSDLTFVTRVGFVA